jgi:hypothetical protein
MAAVQVVFTGVPAFVGVVLSPTKVRFFIDENEFDPAKLIEVDLAKNTAAVPPAQWATSLECDQQTTGGLTTIGPKFHAGPHVGAGYLAQRLVTQYQLMLGSWPPPPDDICQYQAVVRSDNGNVTRYHGFKVQVLSPSAGSHAHIGFVRVGTPGPTGGRASALWIDLADPDICDPASNGFTTIDSTSPVGTVGAVFLRSEVIVLDRIRYPKMPASYGW